MRAPAPNELTGIPSEQPGERTAVHMKSCATDGAGIGAPGTATYEPQESLALIRNIFRL